MEETKKDSSITLSFIFRESFLFNFACYLLLSLKFSTMVFVTISVISLFVFKVGSNFPFICL